MEECCAPAGGGDRYVEVPLKVPLSRGLHSSTFQLNLSRF